MNIIEKCSACSVEITNTNILKCCNNKCSKSYHIECVSMSLESYEGLSEQFMEQWICPECVCAIPKRGNTATPIRSSMSGLNDTFTSFANVNTQQRGSGLKYSPVTGEADSDILIVLNQMRNDLMARLDTQGNAIQHLQNQFSQTKSDLEHLIEIMKVIEKKIDQKYSLNTKEDKNERRSRETVTQLSRTYASTVSQGINRNTDSSPRKNCIPTNNNKSGATKTVTSVQTITKTQNESLPNCTSEIGKNQEGTGIESGNIEECGHSWVEVKNRKRLSKDVRKGQSTDTTLLQAMERKKYLHVWRLHPETKEETLSSFVKNVCGENVQVQIEKIRHKTVRDYSSFIVGVPERIYGTISQPEVWPVNAEFGEWIWFRRSTKRPNEKP